MSNIYFDVMRIRVIDSRAKRSEESSRRLASLRLGRSEARRGKDFKKLDEAKRGEAKACRGEAKRFEKCYLG